MTSTAATTQPAITLHGCAVTDLPSAPNTAPPAVRSAGSRLLPDPRVCIGPEALSHVEDCPDIDRASPHPVRDVDLPRFYPPAGPLTLRVRPRSRPVPGSVAASGVDGTDMIVSKRERNSLLSLGTLNG